MEVYPPKDAVCSSATCKGKCAGRGPEGMHSPLSCQHRDRSALKPTTFSCISMKLLFYDCFRHEGEARKRVDSIRFKTPVVIKEWRIVPNNRVPHPNVKFMGSTYPSSFPVELFAHDVRNPQVILLLVHVLLNHIKPQEIE